MRTVRGRQIGGGVGGGLSEGTVDSGHTIARGLPPKRQPSRLFRRALSPRCEELKSRWPAVI